jgi:broad specificity phosphatase PhoE
MEIYLVRHGETAWSITGQHTGRTDLPLTDQGEQNARKLAPRLKDLPFALVLTSPLQRAKRTCELAGFGPTAVDDPDLMEWNYGSYESRKTVDIRAERPGWSLFRDGCPNGEDLAAVSARADHVVARLRSSNGNALIFSHRDILRVLAVRWCGLPPEAAQRFMLSTASLSILGFDHSPQEPVIKVWNDDRHLA